MTRPRVTAGPLDDIAVTLASAQARLRNLETVGHEHPPAPAPSPWQTFTPTLTNVTLGTGGVLTGYYQRIDYTILFSVSATLGTGGTLAGAVSLTLPFAAARTYSGIFYGWLLDVGTALYDPLFRLASTTTLDVYVNGTASTYATFTNLSSTVPFTWGNTDRIEINGVYETSVAP